MEVEGEKVGRQGKEEGSQGRKEPRKAGRQGEMKKANEGRKEVARKEVGRIEGRKEGGIRMRE